MTTKNLLAIEAVSSELKPVVEHRDAIKKAKLSDQVYKHIREMIIKNQLQSGERIIETKIAKQLGVSQTPVREALRELEAMRLIEIKPYLGCFVRSITKDELYQAYRLRALLESYAIANGAKNFGEAQLRALRAKAVQMRHAADVQDAALFVQYDIEFHEILVKSAHDPLLEKVWRMASASQWTSLTVETSDKPLIFFAELHQPILDCLAAGDIKSLQTEVEVHFNLCAELVRKSFSSLSG